MKNINRQRKASLRILSLAMVVAVYLNWQYSRTSNDEYIFAEGDTQATNGEVIIGGANGAEKEIIESCISPVIDDGVLIFED